MTQTKTEAINQLIELVKEHGTYIFKNSKWISNLQDDKLADTKTISNLRGEITKLQLMIANNHKESLQLINDSKKEFMEIIEDIKAKDDKLTEEKILTMAAVIEQKAFDVMNDESDPKPEFRSMFGLSPKSDSTNNQNETES